jgi:hypothetical protein
MTPGQFFPGWAEQDWRGHRDWLVPDHLGADDDIVQVAFQTWVLRSEGRTSLVDHVGWNTRLVDGQWVPTFPHATYLMPRLDFEHFYPANNALEIARTGDAFAIKNWGPFPSY